MHKDLGVGQRGHFNSVGDLMVNLKKSTGIIGYERKNVSILFTLCIKINSGSINDPDMRKKMLKMSEENLRQYTKNFKSVRDMPEQHKKSKSQKRKKVDI